eukprot:9976993-Lingulodinium_polyedra.AAC.1
MDTNGLRTAIGGHRGAIDGALEANNGHCVAIGCVLGAHHGLPTAINGPLGATTGPWPYLADQLPMDIDRVYVSTLLAAAY